MTAYGHAGKIFSFGRISIEIQSVNRKHLEINTTLPNAFLRFDAEVKKWIGAAVGRGQVNIRISISFEQKSPIAIVPNTALALQMQQAWKTMAEQLDISLSDQALIQILSLIPDMMFQGDELQDEELYKKALKETVDEALTRLCRMKSLEGQSLYEDISARLNLLHLAIEQISIKAPDAPMRYREKLKERLQEVLGASIENEERILREVCVYAEKVDIAEELTRFHSHLKQVKQILESKESAVGKTLEFLIQELNREINTIGSKSSDVEISHGVIQIKTELERIREQIQNIE